MIHGMARVKMAKDIVQFCRFDGPDDAPKAVARAGLELQARITAKFGIAVSNQHTKVWLDYDTDGAYAAACWEPRSDGVVISGGPKDGALVAHLNAPSSPFYTKEIGEIPLAVIRGLDPDPCPLVAVETPTVIYECIGWSDVEDMWAYGRT